jgi:hypothetical protein
MFDYLPEEIVNNGVDALVLDSIDVGSGLIPMHLGLLNLLEACVEPAIEA